jgi:hypothetical protein
MYILQCPETEHRVPPIDDDGTNVFLCWPTLEEAEKGKKYQEDNYDVKGYEIVELSTVTGRPVAQVLGDA